MNSSIKNFIDELEFVDDNKALIVKNLYQIFYEVSKELSEKFIYGGIGFYTKEQLIGGIYVSKKHVSLVFSRGNELIDKYNVLLGEGKWRRHIVITKYQDIYEKHCRHYIEQLINLEVKSQKLK